MTAIPDQGQAALELREVSCVLGGATILQDVSLSVQPGEIVVVLGRSGAGKSTLLRALAGFESIAHGEITLKQGVVSSPSVIVPPERRNIGIVVQSFALFPHLTAMRNVMFGLKDADRAETARRWLERVGLGDRGTAYPHELSGGEQQRIALARALAREPEIVLLDEAFSSLDQQLRQTVRGETKQLLRETGAAVLAVTHDPDEAMELADRIIVMDAGQILQAGPPEELYWQPQSVTAARLLGEINVLRGEVREGVAATSAGSFPTGDLPDGTPFTVLVRPAAMRFRADPTGPAEVVGSRFQAGIQQLDVVGSNGERMRVSAGNLATVEAGTRGVVELSVNRYSLLPD